MAIGKVFSTIEEGRLITIFDANWYQEKQTFKTKKQISLPKKSLRFNFKKALGFLLLAASLAGFLLFLSPIMAAKVQKEEQKGFGPIIAKEIKPLKKNFLISIDKIGLANSKVIRKVNISDEKDYKKALSEGVAHASGTGFPGQGKMVYIFGHSTNYPWFVKDVNALFFKLEILEKGDRIKIEFNGKHFIYSVIDKKVVGAKEVDTIKEYENQDILILQTCFPPGTFWKRLLVFAKPINENNN
jgi:LPXTG-site transpeptidase (sortase) family protein